MFFLPAHSGSSFLSFSSETAESDRSSRRGYQGRHMRGYVSPASAQTAEDGIVGILSPHVASTEMDSKPRIALITDTAGP